MGCSIFGNSQPYLDRAGNFRNASPQIFEFSVQELFKLGIIAYFITMQFIDYLRDTRAELRHVSWPTTKQTINYTIIVLTISIGTGIFLGVVDFGFAQVLKRFI